MPASNADAVPFISVPSSVRRFRNDKVLACAANAGYEISERRSFESHVNCAERFVALVAEECAKLCDDLGDLRCAHAIRSRFPAPAAMSR